MRRETRYGTESYCHPASKVPQVFHDDGDDRASNSSIKSPCSRSGAALSRLISELVVVCRMLVSRKHKMLSPFDQSAYQGSVLLCIQERAYETCANPEFDFCTDPSSPDTGVVYACYTGRIEKRAAGEVPSTNQNFIVDGSPNMGYGLFNFGRNLTNPHHFLGT